MKRYITLLLYIISFSGSLLAQNDLYDRTFAGYAGYLSTQYGITCKMPEEFKDLNQYFVLHIIREEVNSGFLYGPIFQANDKECIVMYPALLIYISKEDIELGRKMAIFNRTLNNDTSAIPEPKKSGGNHSFPRSHVTSEMKAAIGLFDYFGKPLHDSVSFDFNEHVTIIAGKKARKMFNADSIYIYNLPLEEPYQEKYTHRIGMVISKKDRATMIFKLFFTPKGKKKEDEYIELLSREIWYEENFQQEE